jgi:hypothetical protein
MNGLEQIVSSFVLNMMSDLVSFPFFSRSATAQQVCRKCLAKVWRYMTVSVVAPPPYPGFRGLLFMKLNNILWVKYIVQMVVHICTFCRLSMVSIRTRYIGYCALMVISAFRSCLSPWLFGNVYNSLSPNNRSTRRQR